MTKSTAAVSSPTKARLPRQRVPDPGIRCTHKDAIGRQCRSLAQKPKGVPGISTLCASHASEETQIRDGEAVAEYLFERTPELKTAAAINHVLGKLFELIAINYIPVRRGALLAYIGSLLLNSVGPAKGEAVLVKGCAGMDEMFRDAFAIMDQPKKVSDKDDDEDSDDASASAANLKKESIQ
jgi:hypothetical protein